MAEALLRDAFDKVPLLRGVTVFSAGVAAVDGMAISRHSQTALEQIGLGLPKHRSRQLTREMVGDALAIYCMTESHRWAIEEHFGGAGKVFLFREFLQRGDVEVADPYGGSLSDYEICRDELVEAVPSIVAHVCGLLGE